jgi:RNase P subunit RPR2
MHILDAWYYPPKPPSPPKPNMQRLKAQPKLEASTKKIRALHADLDQKLAEQQADQMRFYEGRTKLVRTCWHCGTVNTLHIDRDTGLPSATGECHECGVHMRYSVRVSVPLYPNQFRDALFAKADVGVVHLIDYMHSIGLEDLRMKYTGVAIKDHYRGRDVAGRNAMRDEAILAELMKPLYRVKTQAHIGFKVEGETKDRVCHPDVIAGSTETVYLLEMKKSALDINAEQLAKYHGVMRVLIAKSKQPRSIVTVAVVGERETAVEGEFTTLSELIFMREPWEMDQHLTEHAVHFSKWTGESYIDER